MFYISWLIILDGSLPGNCDSYLLQLQSFWQFKLLDRLYWSSTTDQSSINNAPLNDDVVNVIRQLEIV